MNVLWFEFMLSLRRLWRRKTQNGLMLLTFAMSVTLSLLSWSLFETVHLSQPDFDPKGDYYVMTYAGSFAMGFRQHSSRDEMEAYKAAQALFAEFHEVGFYTSKFIRTPGGEERFMAAFPSSSALRVVGAKPLLGRLFTPAEDKRGSPVVVLLSQRLWENNFGSDPAIVGKTTTMSGEPATIIGVLPREFRFPNDQDLWLSYGSAEDNPKNPLLDAIVKLKPGITPERAALDLKIILDRLGPTSPANKYKLIPALVPLRDFYLLPEVKVSALILFALSVLFVLVSCANAANLMLIDFLGRRSEVAAGLALGIPRRAAIRSVCWQVGLIALGAALIGIAILPVAGPLLYDRVKFLNAPFWLAYHFQWQYVGAALVLAAVSAAVTVVAPIVYLLWVDPDQVIREHATSSRGTGRALWRRLLLTGQIGLLTVLGVTAGLLVRSSYSVGESRWGYPAERIFMGKLVNTTRYSKEEYSPRNWRVLRQALAQVKARPETVATAFVAQPPPGYSTGPYGRYALDPGAFAQHAELGEAFETEVSEDFFAAMDVPFTAGETFAPEAPAETISPVILTESLAHKLWPGQSALQRTLYARFYWMKESEPPLHFVVRGVVRDFQACGPMAKTNDSIFLPLVEKYAESQAFLLVRDRSGVPPFRSLNEAVHKADPRLSLYFPSTLKGTIDLTLSSMKMTADLTTVFAAAAVLLCAVGVYSLTVAQVLQSSREFGIRMALGAEPKRLWRHFTRGHLLAAVIGVALGLVAASQVARLLGTLLYGVDPHGIITYAGVALTILIVAALACIPSLFRLKRINPADCLRSL